MRVKANARRVTVCSTFAGLLALLILTLGLNPSGAGGQEPPVGPTFQTFYFQSGGETFTVPEGVYYLAVDARGGHGGGNDARAPAGGAAGAIDTVIPVTPFQKLGIYAGEYGWQHGGEGYSSGGSGGKVWSYSTASDGQGGGGSTGIVTGPDQETTLLIAGGGGGAGGDDEEKAWGGKGGNGGTPPQGGLNGYYMGGGPNRVGLVGGCGGCSGSPFGGAGPGTGFGDTRGGGGGGGGAGYEGGGGGDNGEYDTGNNPQVANVGGSGGGGGSSWVTGTALNTRFTVSAVDCNGGSQPNINCEGAVTLTWGQPPKTVDVSSGSGQSATVTADFAPIAVKVTDAAGVPATGVSVEFTLPASGPSGLFPGSKKQIKVPTNPLGVASVPRLTANGIGGEWTAEAAVTGLPHKARFTLTNRRAATKTAVSDAPNPSRFGQGVEISARVSSAAPALAPDGLVQFSVDGDPSGYPVEVDSQGKAVLSASEVPVMDPGSHQVEADFLGDDGHSGSSDSTDQVVLRIPTAVMVSADPNPSAAGEQTTLSAAVAGTVSPAGGPTGSVAFTSGPDNLGDAPVGPGGIAELVTDELPLGTNRVEAAYTGDSGYAPGTGTYTQSVGPEATATLVSSSSNPAIWGAPVTWQATVRRSDQGQALEGTIEFSLDGEPLCPAAPIPPSGTVQCSSANPLDAGDHEVEASYLPPTGTADLPSQGNLMQIVTKVQTATSITVDPEPSAFGATTRLNLAVTSASASPVAGQAQMTIDENPAGSTAVPPDGQASIAELCSVASCPFQPGSHVLEALFSPASDNLYPSHVATIHRVGVADTSISLASNLNPVPQNEPLVLSATVTGPDNLAAPGGRVQFLIDGRADGEAISLAGGSVRSMPLNGLSEGEHQVTVHYLGAAGFSPAEAGMGQSVGPPDHDFGTPIFSFLGSNARVDRNGNTRLRSACFGESGASCRLRAVVRTVDAVQVQGRRGRGTVRMPAGTALAARVIGIDTGEKKPVRFDLNNQGSRIITDNPSIPVRVRAKPDPGTAQVAPHSFRLNGSQAPALTIRRSASVSASGRRLRLKVRCHGGDGRACAGRVSVRTGNGKLLARRWIKRSHGRSRKLVLRIRSRLGRRAVLRVWAKSRIRVGRDKTTSRWVRVR